MNRLIRYLWLSSILTLFTFSTTQAQTRDMFGVWGGVTLKGDFSSFSETGKDFQWQIMNQSRTRDDSNKGSRLNENLLMGQVGYRLSRNASIWLGYAHDWIHPLNGTAFQESRVYEDFLWQQNVAGFKLTSRTRMDERINQSSGASGYRARQFFKVSHSLPVKGLSAYIGDEVLFYVDKNHFGKRGFSENRLLAGFNYQLTSAFGLNLGYLGQYVDTKHGANLFTHNLLAGVSYHF